LTYIPGEFINLKQLSDLSISKNKLKFIENDALTGLNNLVMLDLHQNNFEGTFDSIPTSKKLDQLLLGFNSLQSI